MGNKKDCNKKECIIDKACELFLQKSYEGVSIQDICQAVNLTKGALYHHFLNKEDLFKAVIDKYLTGDLFNLNNNESLSHFIATKVELARQLIAGTINDSYTPINYFSLLLDAMRHYPEFKEKKGQFFDCEMSRLKSILTQAIASGEIRKDINIEATAFNISSITLGIAVNVMRTNTYDQALNTYENQLQEFYKLLRNE